MLTALQTRFKRILTNVYQFLYCIAAWAAYVVIAEGMSARSWMKHYLLRLDRIAGELNAWLLAIAIGLGMLDLTVLVAKCMPALPPTPAAASAEGGAAHTV